MTILWIPHSPFQPGSVRRDQHLIRHLKEEHRIISVTWETRESSFVDRIGRGTRFYSFSLPDRRRGYHLRRLPDFTRYLRNEDQSSMWLNGAMFQRDVRRIVEEEDVDLVITAYSRFMTGLPPFDLSIPIIFDYVDCSQWETSEPPERPYIENSDLVTAVSSLAEEQARRFNQNVVKLPNGADVDRLQKASRTRVRKKYDLESEPLVSLIGLIDSPYLVEAVLRAREQIPSLRCLLVGSSDWLRARVAAKASNDDTFIFTGPVPYEEIPDYYAASDVGLYPVQGSSYDNGRSPIKIFEYTAANRPVVAPPLQELNQLNFRNIVISSPNASSFADGIVEAVRLGPTREPSVLEYDWSQLASNLESILVSEFNKITE